MIRTLSQEEAAIRWGEIKPYVDRALEYSLGERTAHDWFIECMEGKAEIWEAVVDGETRSFAVVRLSEFQQHKQVQIVTASGDEWDDYGPEALEFAEDVAKQIKCKYVSIWGRPGWRKKLKPLGYKHAYDVLVKEV